MSSAPNSYRTDKWKGRGRWLCPTCNNHKFKTLAGVNRHLMKEHSGDGFGIYRTDLELQADKLTAKDRQ